MKEFDTSKFYMKGYRIKLYPTIEQKQLIDDCINANIYAYNWALEQEEKQYEMYNVNLEEKSYISEFELDKIFIQMRQQTPWLLKLPCNSARNAIRKVTIAYKSYFKGQNKHPKYKSKKHMTNFSYNTRTERTFMEDNLLRIEGLPRNDMIQTKYHTGFNRKVKLRNCVITRDNCNEYWISFTILTPKPLEYFTSNFIAKTSAIGIDLNGTPENRIVTSQDDGIKYPYPDITKVEKRLRRYQRKCSKDLTRHKQLERNNPGIEIPISKSAKKRKIKCTKAYRKMHNINDNYIKTTCRKIIDTNPAAIVMEDISVTNMNKNYFVAKYTFNAGLYKIREFMDNMCDKFSIPFILADRRYPSSRICSKCGHIRKSVGYPNFICPNCGARIDRHINAARNLESLAYI